MTRQSRIHSAPVGIAFRSPFRDPPLSHSLPGKAGAAKNTAVKNLPEIYGFSRPPSQSGGCSGKHGAVSSRRARTKARRAQPLPGCLGRAPAPARPAGGGLRAEGRGQLPRGKQGPAAACPGLAEAHEPLRPPARRLAPPAPRSHRPRLGRLPSRACRRPPGSPPPLERPSPPAARAPRPGGEQAAPGTEGGRTDGCG